MTIQKLKPCPNCGTADFLAIYTYESGWSRVECDKCTEIFSCCSSKIEAARAHNKKIDATLAANGVK